MTKIILGIDLGTTKCIASYCKDNKYNLIMNDDNTHIFPSIINFTKKGKEISLNDINGIKNFKRFIRKKIENSEINNLCYQLNNNEIKIIDDAIYFFNIFENKYYTVEELNSLLLINIKTKAENQLNTKITDVIITIPAHFNNLQRESILLSSNIAKLNCLRLLNEPSAAAISYGLDMNEDINILVFDLGGGTLDLSILNIDNKIFEVLNTFGDNDLGGEDFTNILVNDAIDKFKEKNKLENLDNSYINKFLLKKKCEFLKCNIKKENIINIENFYINDNSKLNLEYSISENELEKLYEKLLNKIENYLNSILNMSNLEKSDIDYIILVGGGTKLKYIKFKVESFFKKNIINSINPDIVVSVGASILGYSLNNPTDYFSKNLTLIDVLPLSIGIESNNGLMTKIIEKGSKIPIFKHKYFKTERNDMSNVNIKIYQGERTLVNDNIQIGEFILDDINNNLDQNTIIKITIAIDSNSIITVTANEKGTNNNNELLINNNLIKNKFEINKLIEEAEKFKILDIKKSKLFKLHEDANNQLNNIKYNYYYNNLEEKNINLINYIKLVDNKLCNINNFINSINDNYINNEFNIDDIIEKLNLILKNNSEKYPGLILNYNNNDYTIKAFNNIDCNNFHIDNDKYYRKKLKLEIINYINKKNILLHEKITTINNFFYKLESINLDKELYKTYLENFINQDL